MTSRFKQMFILFTLATVLLMPVRAHAICETNAEVTAAQSTVIPIQANKIAEVIANLQASIASILPVELTDLLSKMTGLSTSFRTGLGETWVEWEDAMKDQTAEHNAILIDQSRNLLTGEDAALHNDAELAQTRAEVETVAAAPVNENSCTFDSVMPHGIEVNELTRMVSNTMSSKISNDLIAGEPTLARNARDFEEYKRTFCNRYENGGRAVCDQDGGRMDEDIVISQTLFGKDTLDLMIDPNASPQDAEQNEDFKVINTAVDNLLGRPRFDPIPENVLNSATGMEAMLENRSSIAHINVANGIIWDIVGERFPSKTENEELRELRIASGVPENDASITPSKYEFRNTYIEHVNSPPYIFDLKGTPQILAENELHLKALRLMMMNELNLKMEKMATLFSIQLSNQLGEKEQD